MARAADEAQAFLLDYVGVQHRVVPRQGNDQCPQGSLAHRTQRARPRFARFCGCVVLLVWVASSGVLGRCRLFRVRGRLECLEEEGTQVGSRGRERVASCVSLCSDAFFVELFMLSPDIRLSRRALSLFNPDSCTFTGLYASPCVRSLPWTSQAMSEVCLSRHDRDAMPCVVPLRFVRKHELGRLQDANIMSTFHSC